jgi:hypothetical protein
MEMKWPTKRWFVDHLSKVFKTVFEESPRFGSGKFWPSRPLMVGTVVLLAALLIRAHSLKTFGTGLLVIGFFWLMEFVGFLLFDFRKRKGG